MKLHRGMIVIAGLLAFALAACQAPVAPGGLEAASRAAALPQWDKAAVYLAGANVAWKNHAWKAGWWTQGEEPGTTGQWGVWKDQGIIDSDTQKPTAPGNFAASGIEAFKASLSWTASTDNVGVTGYELSLNGGAAIAVNGLAYQCTGLLASTRYTATVVAKDAAGNKSDAASVTFTTPAAPVDKDAPVFSGSVAVSKITASSAVIDWPAATDNVAVTGYRLTLGSNAPVTVSGTTHTLTGLSAKTAYSGTVVALDAAGNVSAPLAFSFQTIEGGSGNVVSSGYVDFHLHIGVSPPQDRMVLEGERYTDLIMTNYVAGAMLGHLINSYYPGIKYDRDYLYGSVFAQLLQENMSSELYDPAQDLLAPHPTQQPVMAAGQGGPYQINNYGADMVGGGYTPQGHSLINFVTLQKNIGFTYAEAHLQHARTTPASFNNKYYGPMLATYFHYLDFVALIETGKGVGGWKTPWQPDYDNALVNFKNLPNNFLDVILNCSYNQGSYGELVTRYSRMGATANAATIATIRSYSNVWGKGWYEQYPYQVMYYLDQLYSRPIPSTSSATDLITRQAHIAFDMNKLGFVFSKAFQTLAWQDAAGAYAFIPAAKADTAWSKALAECGIAASSTLDLSATADRARIFDVMEKAIAILESDLGTKFNATVTRQL